MLRNLLLALFCVALRCRTFTLRRPKLRIACSTWPFSALKAFRIEKSGCRSCGTCPHSAHDCVLLIFNSLPFFLMATQSIYWPFRQDTTFTSLPTRAPVAELASCRTNRCQRCRHFASNYESGLRYDWNRCFRFGLVGRFFSVASEFETKKKKKKDLRPAKPNRRCNKRNEINKKKTN